MTLQRDSKTIKKDKEVTWNYRNSRLEVFCTKDVLKSLQNSQETSLSETLFW